MAMFEFRNLSKIVPDAYHGTLAPNVELILRDGFKVSRGIELHLGSGVYFYESSVAWAEYWALKKRDDAGGGAEIAILSAEVRLGRCIDLNDREHQRILAEFAKAIEERVSRGTLAGDFRKITPAFIYNLAAQRSNADTIRKPYGPSRDNERISGWTGRDFTMRLVICVRRTENISNVAVVRIGTQI